MADWPLVAIRWALYADLGLLFGVPLFGLYAAREVSPPIGRLCAGLAVAGLALSLLGLAFSAAAMGGTTIGRIDRAILFALVWQTDAGRAWLVRMVALVLIAALLPLVRGRMRAAVIAGLGGVAVASLAWFGHGAAGEGASGLVRLAADIAHLLAASAWIGALLLLLMLVGTRGPMTRPRIAAAHAALAGFGMTGTAMVAILIVTGLVNGAFLIGPRAIPTLGDTPYGRLLIAKLLLFVLMLGCAALNRFRLTPRLGAASDSRGTASALAALRRSITMEALLALAIMALVGWLGTLEPVSATA